MFNVSSKHSFKAFLFSCDDIHTAHEYLHQFEAFKAYLLENVYRISVILVWIG